MFKSLNISSFLQLVAMSAMVLLVWRGMEFVSSGGLQSPLWRAAVAQETPTEDAEAAEETELPDAEPADTQPEAPDPNKRLTASEVMKLRATDVSENMGSNGELLESERNVLVRLAERREQIEKLEQETRDARAPDRGRGKSGSKPGSQN